MPPQTSCPPCSLTFPTRLALRTHIRHSASHPACLPCHRRFLDQHSLAAHQAQSQFHSSRRLSTTTATATKTGTKNRRRRRRRHKRGRGGRGDVVADCGTSATVVGNGYGISGRKYPSPNTGRSCVDDVERGESGSRSKGGSEAETETSCCASPSSSSSSVVVGVGVGEKKKNPRRFWHVSTTRTRKATNHNPRLRLLRGRRLRALPRPLSVKRVVSGAVLVAARYLFSVVVVGGGVLMVWMVFWRGGGRERAARWV